MSDIIVEHVTNDESVERRKEDQLTQEKSSFYQTVNYIVYFLFGMFGILLAFRFIFKLLGANPSSIFVNFVYSLSNVFVAPFNNIFNASLASGDVTTSVFEPATLIAFVVYAALAWAIVALTRAIFVNSKVNV